MAGEGNRRPDEVKMRRLLERERTGPEGLVLRLAWLEGLSRDEIGALTWDQVSFLDDRLELPDRMTPLDPDVRACLWRLHEAREVPEGSREKVLLSARGKRPPRMESISRMARSALDRGGMPEIRLVDLRYDWMLRQVERLDWPEAARVCGVEVSTLQSRFAGLVPERKPSVAEPAAELDEFKLWKILQTERRTPAGLALWMAWQLGLQAKEMTELTWDRVDFRKNLIRLPDRDVPLTSAVRRLLEEAPRSDEDSHVLLTARSRKPIDLPHLSRMTRSALIRGGLDHAALRDLRRNDSRSEDDAQLLRLAAEQGTITRQDVSDLLGLSKTASYSRLRRLTDQKRLVRVGGKYYLSGTVVPPERHLEAIKGYLEQAGFAYRQDIVELLHIQPKQCSLVLRHFVEAGDLIQRGQRYFLPLEGERKAE